MYYFVNKLLRSIQYPLHMKQVKMYKILGSGDSNKIFSGSFCESLPSTS